MLATYCYPQSCNIVFATDHAANMLDASKSSFLRQVARRVAGRFRSDQDVLVSHILFDTNSSDKTQHEIHLSELGQNAEADFGAS